MRAIDIGQVIFKLLHETGKAEPIQLIPGQVISVLVREIRGNTALLSYQGKEIIARLESEVPPGENIRCLVEGERNGRIVLKMLDNSQGNAEFFHRVLRDLGIKINDANIRLVSEMIRQEMPLTPDSVRILAAFAGSQGIPGADMRVPVFMHKHGMPLTGEMYQFTRELLTDIKFLQDELMQMSLFNQRLAAGAGHGTQQARLAEALHQLLSGLGLNSADRAEIIAAKIADIFSFQAGRPVNSAAGEPGLPQQQNQLLQTQTQAAMQGGVPQAGLTQPGAGPNVMPQPGAPQTGAANSGGVLNGGQQAGSAQGQGQQSGIAQTGTAETGTVPGGNAQGGLAPGVALQGEMVPGGARLAGMQQDGAVQYGVTQGGTARSGGGPSVTVQSAAVQSGTARQGTPQSGNAEPGAAHDGAPKGTPGSGAAQAEIQGPGASPGGNERVYQQVLAALREAGDQGQRVLITLLADKLAELLADRGVREHGELLQLTKSVTDRLEFLQDFNNRVEVNRDNTLVMYSTISFEDRQEPLRLMINYRYDSKKQMRDFSSCRVEVKLNTMNMGLVRCEIQVAEQSLTLQFVTPDQQTCNIIDKLKGTLARRLEDMSYTVRMLESRVETKDPDSILHDENDMSGMFQLNLRV